VAVVGRSQLLELWKVHGRSAMVPCILWQSSSWLIVTSQTMDVLVDGPTLHMTVTSAGMGIAQRTPMHTLQVVDLAELRLAM